MGFFSNVRFFFAVVVVVVDVTNHSLTPIFWHLTIAILYTESYVMEKVFVSKLLPMGSVMYIHTHHHHHQHDFNLLTLN